MPAGSKSLDPRFFHEPRRLPLCSLWFIAPKKQKSHGAFTHGFQDGRQQDRLGHPESDGRARLLEFRLLSLFISSAHENFSFSRNVGNIVPDPISLSIKIYLREAVTARLFIREARTRLRVMQPMHPQRTPEREKGTYRNERRMGEMAYPVNLKLL